MRCNYRCNMRCNCKKPVKKKSLDNKARMDDGKITLFSNDVSEDNTISVVDDPETGGLMVEVGSFLSIEDEATRQLFIDTFLSLDAEAYYILFNFDDPHTGSYIGIIIDEAMAQINALLNNPTNEQADILKSYLEEKASDESESPIVERAVDIILADWNSYGFEDYEVGAQSFGAQTEQRWEWDHNEGPYSPYTLTINGRQYYEITPTSESSIEGKVDILGEVITFSGDVETDETGKETIRIEIFSS